LTKIVPDFFTHRLLLDGHILLLLPAKQILLAVEKFAKNTVFPFRLQKAEPRVSSFRCQGGYVLQCRSIRAVYGHQNYETVIMCMTDMAEIVPAVSELNYISCVLIFGLWLDS